MIEVIIPTMGSPAALNGCLSGLLPQTATPFNLRLITAKMNLHESTQNLLEIFRRMGVRVTIDLHPDDKTIASARAVAAEVSTGDILIMLDDDAVLCPHDAIMKLANAAAKKGRWVSPIIRYVSNFIDPEPGHTEVWEPVTADDPRVASSLASRGPGWIRVYETGQDVESDKLGGTCFAAPATLYRSAVEDLRLKGWMKNYGGEDFLIGKGMGKGLILSGVYAYHFGKFSLSEWGFSDVAQRLLERMPEAYQDIASGKGDPHVSDH